jgi:hypothetical protein
MSESLYRKLSMLAACDGAQESGDCADVVGGWVEGDGRVKAIALARIKVVENFSKPSESWSGLAAYWRDWLTNYQPRQGLKLD